MGERHLIFKNAQRHKLDAQSYHERGKYNKSTEALLPLVRSGQGHDQRRR